MTALETWRNTAFERAKAQSMAGVERWQRGAPLYWWFGKFVFNYPRGGTSSDHLFWELHYDQPTRAWIVCGAVISVNPANAFPSIHPFIVEKKRDDTHALQRLAFGIVKIFPMIAYDCVLELTATPATDSYELRQVRISIAGGATKPRKSGWLAQLIGPGKSDARIDECLDSSAPDALGGKLVDIACPDCAGLGAKKTFAIPQADWDSGATGYALFSANTINATVACTTCGGSGATYEAWYLAEQPALRATAKPLIKGRGKVQARRLPCRGNLKPV